MTLDEGAASPPRPASSTPPGGARAGPALGRARSLAAVLGVLIALATTVIGAEAAARRQPASPQLLVRVVGNRLENGAGQAIRLLGVDRSGLEFACAQGWGLFDGPSDAASVAVIASWHVDAVRLPLNEDCWLGINGVASSYGGAAYQQAVEGYVRLLNADGIVAILDLHWNAPGGELALAQQEMADADHSPAFWESVASAFASDPGVVFDLYNEPHDISWSCWLDGCTTSGGWQAAGMQSLVDAVRSTGATQPIMLAGLDWAGDLSGWLAHEPVDPLHQLVASVHVYDFSGCSTVSCWTSEIAPVAAVVPVVTGELGTQACSGTFPTAYMDWADTIGISYLGWTWNDWSCTTLVTDYAGDATPFGAALEGHLAALAAASATGSSGSSGAGTTSTAAGVPGSSTSTAPPTASTVPSTAPATTAPAGTALRATSTSFPVAASTSPGAAAPAPAPAAGSPSNTAPAPGRRRSRAPAVRWLVIRSSNGDQAVLVSIRDRGRAALGSARRPWRLVVGLPPGTRVTSVGGARATRGAGPARRSWTLSGAPIGAGKERVVSIALRGAGLPTSCRLDGTPCVVVSRARGSTPRRRPGGAGQ